MNTTPSPEVPQVHYKNPWFLVIAIDFGHSAALASSIGLVNLLLPQIMPEIGADVRSIQWVQTSFLITMVILLPAVGWLSSAVGQRRLYLIGLGLFGVSTVLCTFAWNLPSLLFFRVIQGAGAGLFFPLGTPFIFDAFPSNRRGFVLGVSTLLMSINSLGGSVLASHLADLFGWRWGFYFLFVEACIGLLFSITILKERRIPKVGQFDFPGCATMALALMSLLLLITRESHSGFFTPEHIFLSFTFIASAGAFFYIEKKTAEPFVDLRLYRHTAYAAGSFIGFLVPAISVGISFLLPIYLQGLLGYSIFQTALIRLPSGLFGTLFTPLAGWLSDRSDSRLLVSGGLLALMLATATIATITPETSPVSLALMLTVMSIATAFIFTPISNTMFSSLPHESIRLGSGLYALKRQLGRSLGTAIISVLFADRLLRHTTQKFDAWALPNTVTRSLQAEVSMRFPNASTEIPNVPIFLIQDTLLQNATIAAFSECFLIVAACLLLSFIPIPYLRTPKN
ncbi:MAG: DHA2 family efflux MFS transporter permease subunit [Candidatus Latescibacteria bacterium]|jgi:EmrB/QacA subfamily drug resistance transporter|nr:DHA2 family efflux MFS transporter permease subunit [Candidatus Latescibacterota bacterium]MBT4138118.1 DHA2 family efflux MFS transporter permease subunit [Candidatus Latescibacterota bacterium]MBT5831116.1 DHA2 family efflux MFS transporter permease subunit [Candidatus Latescibacterota bacterium]